MIFGEFLPRSGAHGKVCLAKGIRLIASERAAKLIRRKDKQALNSCLLLCGILCMSLWPSNHALKSYVRSLTPRRQSCMMSYVITDDGDLIRMFNIYCAVEIHILHNSHYKQLTDPLIHFPMVEQCSQIEHTGPT